jgi:hypothetical protein
MRRPAAYILFFSMLCISLISCKKKDSAAPVITINGDNPVFVPLNGTYTDPGATAYDAVDGVEAVSTDGEVNTNLEGSYDISYQAYDATGNNANATRTVFVQNQAKAYMGIFSSYVATLSDTLYYLASVITSTTINNRIWIQSFGTDSNQTVYADIDSLLITIPKQLGTQIGTQHYLWGSGTISHTDSIKIVISFADSLSGSIQNGVIRYTKP